MRKLHPPSDLDGLLTDIEDAAFQFCERFSEESVPTSNKQLVAASTLPRALSHLRAIRMLLEKGFVVEARTLTRNAIECLFYVAALTGKDGQRILEEMGEADVASRKRRAEFLITRKIVAADDGSDAAAKMRQWLANPANKPKMKRDLSAEALAKRGDAVDAYLFYDTFSYDSAHVTVSSLNRYVVTEDGEIVGLDLAPEASDDEIAETKFALSMALIATLVSLAEMFKLDTNGALAALWERHKAIRL